MSNKNPISAVRTHKPLKKQINQEVLARFQIEPVEPSQGSSRRRLKKLCQVNESEEMIEPEEEEHVLQELQYQQFDVKDDEELKKEKQAEERAKQNKKLKGNQELDKFIEKHADKDKKPKKMEKEKPQPQMSMQELMRIKKEKKQRRKSSDGFLGSDKDQKDDEEIDEQQLLAKRMAAYEIYNNGNKGDEKMLIQKAMQLSYTATSKKDEKEDNHKTVDVAPWKNIFSSQNMSEKQSVKQQPKISAKKEPKPISLGPLAGLVISVTGDFDNFNKDELKQVCQKLGAQCPSSMVNRCNLLFQGSHVDNDFKKRTNQPVEETEKSRKARERGIKIVPYNKIDQFFMEKTGKDFESHLKKSNNFVANPLSSILFKPIETEIDPKVTNQYKQIRDTHKEPPKIVQAEAVKAYNPPPQSIKREQPIRRKQPIRREQTRPEQFMRRQQKMEIEKPKTLPTPMTAGMLWSDKYKPTKLEDVIGESSQIKSLREWLECWEDIHIRGNKRDVKQTKGWNAAGSINSFAALLSGDPGIGKTSTARLLATEYKYAVTQFNASDVRNKSGIDLMETGSFNLGKRNMEKSLIIMDQVDGMSSGDRGGITAIINMIKSTKVPIICICNDRSSDKIRSLAGHCLDVKFQKPQKGMVVRRLKEILNQQGGFGQERALEQLVDTFQNDMRQILCYLEVIFKTVSHKITMDTLSSRNQSSKDATVMINHFDAVKRLLNRSQFNRMPIGQRTDCFFVDSDMVPLMVQQNILQSARRTSLSQKQFHSLVQGLHGMVIGDLLDKTIRKQQEWGLMPSYGFMTCVYAPEKISQSIGFPQFPSWLGKFSSERKMKRLSKEFKDAISPMSIINSWKTAKQHYVPLIIREMCELLKQQKIEDAVQLMEQYNITPGMIGDHLTSLHFNMSNDKYNPLNQISSTVKGKLTRLFNKRHEDSKMRQATKGKTKVEHVKFDPLMEELEDVEEEEPEEENQEEEVKAKPKHKKK